MARDAVATVNALIRDGDVHQTAAHAAQLQPRLVADHIDYGALRVAAELPAVERARERATFDPLAERERHAAMRAPVEQHCGASLLLTPRDEVLPRDAHLTRVGGDVAARATLPPHP